MAHTLLILAQTAPGGGYAQLLIFGLMIAVMYFLLIRPQQKQLKEHRSLIAGLKKGDDVVTQGGLIGKIHAVTEREVQLEIANGVRVRVLKTSVTGRRAEDAPAKTEESKEEKK